MCSTFLKNFTLLEDLKHCYRRVTALEQCLNKIKYDTTAINFIFIFKHTNLYHVAKGTFV